jgi:hypothetical protein
MDAVFTEECMLSSRAKLTMAELIRRANSHGECYPSAQTIARVTNLSTRSVQRALGEIAAAARAGTLRLLVDIEHRYRRDGVDGGRDSNLYRLMLLDEAPRDTGDDERQEGGHDDGDLAATSRQVTRQVGGGLSARVAQESTQRTYSEESTQGDAQGVPPRRKSITRSRGLRRTMIPPDFRPDTVTTEVAAKELGFDDGRLADELAKFADYALECDRRACDWQAAFRRWLRRARVWDPAGGRQRAKPLVQAVNGRCWRLPKDAQ